MSSDSSPVVTPATFTVYHADHSIPTEVMEWMQRKLEDEGPQGFFIQEFAIPENLPAARNALYGPASGDGPVSDAEATLRPRGDRPWSDRTVLWPTRPTRQVQVIGVREGDTFTLFTVYGGPLAPQHPDDPGNRDPEGARAFWSQHALSIEQWA